MPDDVLISINNLAKSYQETGQRHSIFSELDFTVRQGEFVVLLGRSGSGKSTLLNLVSGIDRPSNGQIFINGIDLVRLSEKQRTLFRRQYIGFIFQNFNLIPTLTVFENVLLPLELQRKTGRQDRQTVSVLLEQLGILNSQRSYPEQLSGGEQQRVAIARALIHQPKLILADEPTGNLDRETGEQVMFLLNERVRSAGKTLLMATHSEEMIDAADKVFTIRDKQLTRLA